MTDYAFPQRPAWADALLAAVDRAFDGADAPGWSDPHPDRNPLEEEYSRVTDPGRYRILGRRVDAWVQALTDSGLGVAREVPSESWVAEIRSSTEHSRVLRLDPVRSEGLSLLLATTLVGGEPFGLDVGVADGARRSVFLTPIPDCGCDACDSGSADLLAELDSWVLTIVRGGVVHAQRGQDSATRTFEGWRTSGGGQEAWLDQAVPAGVEIRAGTSWV